MKRLLLPFILAATLSGCAVVAPYEHPDRAYSPEYIYNYPYAVAPVYASPVPVYGRPIYAGPPVRFSFGLNYRSGGWRHHRHHHGFGHRHYRPWHYGGFRGHHFRGGWRR